MTTTWTRPTQQPIHPNNWDRWSSPTAQHDDFRVTQTYDAIDKYWLSQGITKIHGATDIGDGKCGAKLLSMRPGLLTHVEDETPASKGGPALGVHVDCHDGWEWELWHLETRTTKSGIEVPAGVTVGTLGNTGLDIGGCHCHIKVKHDGVWVDPTPILLGATDSLEVPVAPFLDVKPGDPFYADIKWLKDKGLSSGVGDTGKFVPKGLVTRAQQAAMLRRLYSLILKDT